MATGMTQNKQQINKSVSERKRERRDRQTGRQTETDRQTERDRKVIPLVKGCRAQQKN